MVRISGGPRAFVEIPFLITNKQSFSYPIIVVEDNVPGVSYSTGTKGWIYRRVMVFWHPDRRALRPLDGNRKRVLLMDNY